MMHMIFVIDMLFLVFKNVGPINKLNYDKKDKCPSDRIYTFIRILTQKLIINLK